MIVVNESLLASSLAAVFAMGLVIIFCRAFPFLFFSKTRRMESESSAENDETEKGRDRRAIFFSFVERIVPPVAMTVLAFNALGAPFIENPIDGLLGLSAALFTALVHLWKKNALISIFTGTALYMILIRVII